MMKFVPLILRNLIRNKRRTALTVLSIAVSLFVFASLMSLPSVVNLILRDRAASLRLMCISKGGMFYSLPEAYRTRIQSIPHVGVVIGVNLFMGTYRGPDEQVPSMALDSEGIDAMLSDFGISPGGAAAFQRIRTACLVGSVLMDRFHWRVGDTITLRGTIYPVDVRLVIVGSLSGKSTARFALLFRRDYLKEIFGGIGYANLFLVKVDRSRSIPSVIAEIDRTFANSPAETLTQSELGASQSQMGGFQVLITGAEVLAMIVIVAVGLVAANTAAMSVRERRTEIAVMRAIGFSRQALLVIILIEGTAIGMAGGLFGCGIAYTALRLIRYTSSELGPITMTLRLPRSVFIESMCAATAIGAISSLAPALRASRTEISASLRAA